MHTIGKKSHENKKYNLLHKLKYFDKYKIKKSKRLVKIPTVYAVGINR
jgi:cephalosporin-C deacetylase-like acetyl esterase